MFAPSGASLESSGVDKSDYCPSGPVNWPDWSSYQCSCCGENAINRLDSVLVESELCVLCMTESPAERWDRLESRKIERLEVVCDE